MKAAVINEFGGPEKLQIVEVPNPVLSDKDVKIKMKASSINPVDWKIRKGFHKYTLGSNFPIILGFDAAGEVVDTGKDVKKFKKGDLVYGRLDKKFGKAYAEYAVGAESVFALKPEKLSFEEAAAIPLAAQTALQALRDKGKIQKGHKVLINGAASGVGHFAVQLVQLFKADCYAVSSFRHKKLIDELKPDVFIDYTKENFKNRSEKFDIIFDVAGTETFLTCKHLLARGGIYITSLPKPKLIYHKLVSLFTAGKKVKTLLMKPRGYELDQINQWISENKFRAHIDKVFPLEKIADAHTYSQEGHAEGKIIIKIG
ncbi:MAG: NADP-dependent oxidoreductase [Bacteroidales bacterium]|nr:NADP-dependent oxidoreductase [Bacteroidales bacterium]